MATTGQGTFYKISKACLLLFFDSQPFPFPANRNREDCPHWLLALTISFSRSDRAHTDQSRSWCRVSQRTVPDVLHTAGKSPSGAGRPRGLIRRACHLIRSAREGQRVRARK